jgi:uncharacterized protein
MIFCRQIKKTPHQSNSLLSRIYAVEKERARPGRSQPRRPRGSHERSKSKNRFVIATPRMFGVRRAEQQPGRLRFPGNATASFRRVVSFPLLARGHFAAFENLHSGLSRTCFFHFAQYTVVMKNDVLPVQIRGILPANSGCALFVGNDEKVFVINVEPQMGAIISMFLRDTPKERPLTHDLIQSIFKGFTISVERVVITELKNSTYFARLILQQQNELARKIVEIDARPSDCLALATAQKRPIYVTHALFEQVEDMSEVLDRINETGTDAGETGESE